MDANTVNSNSIQWHEVANTTFVINASFVVVVVDIFITNLVCVIFVVDVVVVDIFVT